MLKQNVVSFIKNPNAEIFIHNVFYWLSLKFNNKSTSNESKAKAFDVNIRW